MEATLTRCEPSALPLTTTSWHGAPPQRGNVSVKVCGRPAMRVYRLGPNVGANCAALDEANSTAPNAASSAMEKYFARMVISLANCGSQGAIVGPGSR